MPIEQVPQVVQSKLGAHWKLEGAVDARTHATNPYAFFIENEGLQIQWAGVLGRSGAKAAAAFDRVSK